MGSVRDEVDRLIPDDVGEVPRGTIGLLLPAPERDEGIEHRIDGRSPALDSDAELTDKPGVISGRPELSGIAIRDVGLGDRRHAKRITMGTLDKTSQDRRPTRCADARRHERIAKPHALGRQPVDARRFHDRMTGAAEYIGAVVIGEKENDVRAFVGEGVRYTRCE